MNFLKISGLVIGTGSFVGGSGVGIYYGIIKNAGIENTENNNVAESDEKINFVGKLAFFKKSGESTSPLYEVKLLTDSEYANAVIEFDRNAADGNKHQNINKVIEISHSLNPETTKSELTNIFTSETTLENAKTKILEKETELKVLFGDTIYSSLNTLIS